MKEAKRRSLVNGKLRCYVFSKLYQNTDYILSIKDEVCLKAQFGGISESPNSTKQIIYSEGTTDSSCISPLPTPDDIFIGSKHDIQKVKKQTHTHTIKMSIYSYLESSVPPYLDKMCEN